jgi:glycosyltransferase involved in cell wall biosynthesis
MNKINYTIAVMIYNVEKFLRPCIESCISQKGDDIEILLINDGSKDNSGIICDEYAKKDPRILVIHKTNGGVSSARNQAIKNARGKWLIMVDGDDVLSDLAVTHGRNYLNDDSDLLQFDALPFVDTIDFKKWKAKSEEMLVTGKLLEEYHLQLIDRSITKITFPTYNMNPAWSKMWNMEFIKTHNLLYDEKVHKGEGTLFTFSASYMIKKVRFIPAVIYGYRINPSSIMNRFSSGILEMQNVQFMAYDNLIKSHNEYENTDIQHALNNRGIYLIENAIHLTIAHLNCPWNFKQIFAWINELYNLSWVKQVAKFQEKENKTTKISKCILKNDVFGLFLYCKYIKFRKIIRRILSK